MPLPTLLECGNLVARMGEVQKDLNKIRPIDYIIEWIDSRLPAMFSGPNRKINITISDRVIILLSKTGSGKSTSLPPEIYLRLNRQYRKQIVVTQPRVLTAVEIPDTIMKIKDYTTGAKFRYKLEYGLNLGYQTQEFVKKPLKNGILFATVGILLQFLKTMSDEDFMKRYKFIIIDEVHERSVDIDIIMFLMKSLILRNIKNDPPFLILMSATFDSQKYADYFGTKTIFEVKGVGNPIDERFLEYDTDNYVSKTVETIIDIHKNNESDYYNKDGSINYNNKGDIIVFVSTTAICNLLSLKVESINKKIKDKLLSVIITGPEVNEVKNEYNKLYSSLNKYKIVVDNKEYKPTRKVIFATNVAETGLTLPNLKYCIDTGFNRSVEYNPRYNLLMSYIKPVTKGMAMQRRGRVGREHNGVFYGMYTKDVFDKYMIADKNPDILTADISTYLLSIKASIPTIDIDSIDLMTKPSDESRSMALTKLFTLGTIDHNKDITHLGELMNKFIKLSLESRRLILSGIYYNVNLNDLIVIACYIEMGKQSFFSFKFNGYESIFSSGTREDIDYFHFNKLKNRLLVSCEMIDFLIFYKRFNYFVGENIDDLSAIKKWCSDKYIKYEGMLKLMDYIDEVTNTLAFTININPFDYNTSSIFDILISNNNEESDEFINEVIKIKNCIYEGYKMNILVRDHSLETNIYKSLTTHINVRIDSELINDLNKQTNGSAIIQSRPKYILYTSIMLDCSKGTDIYTSGPITVLDGFIDIDFGLLES